MRQAQRYLCLLILMLTGLAIRGMVAGDIYVATNGNNTAGTNWNTAFTTLTNAWPSVQDGDTVYMAGQTFLVTAQTLLDSRADVSILGGHEAASDVGLPGTKDPAQWPTILERDPTVDYTRILELSDLTNCVLKDLTLFNGHLDSYEKGAGAFIQRVNNLMLDSCQIVSNTIYKGTSHGAGVYILSGSVTITNSVIEQNRFYPAPPNSYCYGGGLFLAGGTTTITGSRIVGNSVKGNRAANGGGIYVAASAVGVMRETIVANNSVIDNAAGGGIFNLGTLSLENCLVAHNEEINHKSDGIYADGTLSLMNCTVVDNGDGDGYGIRGAGSGKVSITNSILWGHVYDLYEIPVVSNVFYSCIQDVDSSGVQGCIAIDPLFAETTYYHLQSTASNYINGYFSGGEWGTSLSNSPAIDRGNPGTALTKEPAPNGGIVNMGYDGNTAVASHTPTIDATSPIIVNHGASEFGHRTVNISAEVTDTGGDTPTCGFEYWITGSAVTSSVPAGPQLAVFSKRITGLVPNSAYQFRLIASNRAGVAVSDTMSFSMHPSASSLYVATNGNNTAGTNWSTAYTDPQTGFNVAEAGDTVYLAGHVFEKSPDINTMNQWIWSGSSNVSVSGGYQAASDAIVPGPKGPTQWPTILGRNPAISYSRILELSDLTNCVLKDLTLFNGYLDANGKGAGVFIQRASNLMLDSCQMFSNTLNRGSSCGAGVYIVSGSVTITNSVIEQNRFYPTPNNSYSYGGGVYLAGGTTTITGSRIVGNSVKGNRAANGGGIYVAVSAVGVMRETIVASNSVAVTAAGGGIYNLGKLSLENCLVVHNEEANHESDGIYSSGTLSLMNCTVADNGDGGGYGIRRAGSGNVSITNSIIWGHLDDLYEFLDDGQIPPVVPNVVYSCIQGGDNNGAQGCINLDPLFVDTTYYHLQSTVSNYVNGYFSGGEWGASLSNSPAIDKCDAGIAPTAEQAPHGDIVNMGYDGNTAVASLTATINATLPAITNRGATVAGHRTVTFSAEVTDTGDDAPTCDFEYWITGSAVTSSVSAGIQLADFARDVAGLEPDSAYQFRAMVSNAAGAAFSDIMSFSTHPLSSSLYVATKGNNTAGTNWSTAYTDPQTAFNVAEAGDNVYLAGHVFERSPDLNTANLWTWSGVGNVSVIGAYRAADDLDLPGPRDPAQWPTVLTRTSGVARILYLDGLTNVALQGLTIRDGLLNVNGDSYGAGLYLTGCRSMTLNQCTISNNLTSTTSANQRGGGIFSTSSDLIVTNSMIIKNTSTGTGNGGGHGGGIFIDNGSLAIYDSRMSRNVAGGAGQNVATPRAGGFYLNTGSTSTMVRTVIDGNRSVAQGGGIYSLGLLTMANVLVVTNNASLHNSDGLYSSGNAALVNCTVADNGHGVGVGVLANGSVSLTNCIVWGHGDDVTGTTVSIAYSDMQTAEGLWTNGVNGCISADPLFVDSVYYHLESRKGNYLGGYFSGGTWGNSLSNSLCINTGYEDPAKPWRGVEPDPNGRRSNMGAYGNTTVASKGAPSVSTLFIIR